MLAAPTVTNSSPCSLGKTAVTNQAAPSASLWPPLPAAAPRAPPCGGLSFLLWRERAREEGNERKEAGGEEEWRGESHFLSRCVVMLDVLEQVFNHCPLNVSGPPVQGPAAARLWVCASPWKEEAGGHKAGALQTSPGWTWFCEEQSLGADGMMDLPLNAHEHLLFFTTFTHHLCAL